VDKPIARGNAAWEEGIVVAYHGLVKARKGMRENPEKYSSIEGLHRAFHAAIIAACDSRWLSIFSDVPFDQAGRYRIWRLTAASCIGTPTPSINRSRRRCWSAIPKRRRKHSRIM
jgi:DNA-binding GntR family transcriptional regulator